MEDFKQAVVVEELARVLSHACQVRDAVEKSESWIFDEWCVLLRFILSQGLEKKLTSVIADQAWNEDRKNSMLEFIANTMASGELL